MSRELALKWPLGRRLNSYEYAENEEEATLRIRIVPHSGKMISFVICVFCVFHGSNPGFSQLSSPIRRIKHRKFDALALAKSSALRECLLGCVTIRRSKS